MNSKYEVLLSMPHHVSKSHPQMSAHDRAAQFSPFAALTGYEGVLQETGRVTEQRIDLTAVSYTHLTLPTNSLV